MGGKNRIVQLLLVLLVTVALAACANAPGLGQTASGDEPAANSKEKPSGLFSGLIPASKLVTLPAGTEIDVVLDQSIASNSARSGEAFEASLAAPVMLDGKTIVPKGSRVRGVVIESRESGHLQTPARLRLALSTVQLGGKSYDIQTTSITRVGADHKQRNWVLIGGGTGVGTTIGAIAGGGKGAAIGALAGAGAGTAAAAATGKRDLLLPAETRLNFKLSQPVQVELKG